MIVAVALAALLAQAPALFTPPTGWTLRPDSVNKQAGVFVKLGDYDKEKRAFLRVLQSNNVGLSSQKYAESMRPMIMNEAFPGSKLLSNSSVSLCGGSKGTIWVLEQKSPGIARHVRVVFATSAAHGYMMLYVRGLDVRDDADALGAQASLCPPTEAAVVLEDPPTIKVPAGYVRSGDSQLFQRDDQRVWFWVNAANGQEIQIVGRPASSVGATAGTMYDELLKNVSHNISNMRVLEKKRVSLCGFDGLYVRMSGTSQGEAILLDQVLAPSTPLDYFVVYERRPEATDTAALWAIQSICPATPAPQSTPTP